jgi:Zn finger protein HypA/HybF involved in hydrogenase expression
VSSKKDKKNKIKTKKKSTLRLTFSAFSDRLFPVMRDRIELEEVFTEESTFKCWNCEETHPIEIKKDWGFNEVCPRCDLHLFDEAEKRDKRRDW